MKRKIAVFGNGWSNEYLRMVMGGVRRCAVENNVDIFLFVDYSSEEGADSFTQTGETNIFTLPRLDDFDGVLLLANTFHLPWEFQYLQEQVRASRVPAVSLEYELEGMDYLGTDNYSGMFELARHLLERHGVQKILYMSGPGENAESNIRRQAVADAMREAGLILREEDVLCGSWSYDTAQAALETWLDGHRELPDAVMCANDVMAMGVCALLAQRGINVPEQIRVTGYDRLLSGVAFSPMLASVDRSWEHIGYQGLCQLLNRIGGKETLRRRMIPTRASVAESCGCEPCRETIRRLREGSGTGYNRLVDNVYLAGRMCGMAEYMSDIRTEDELHQMLGEFWKDQQEYGIHRMYLCLDERFFSSLQDNEPLSCEGYSDTSDLICGVSDGCVMERARFQTRKLVPDYDGESAFSHVYIFLPLYRKNERYGYIAFGNEIPMLYDYTLNTWMTNLKLNLERVRQSLKLEDMYKELERLSITDSLTGIYNRMACEKLAYPLLESSHSAGRSCALMFIDINRMKLINDRYGHSHGDLAICTVAAVLKETLPAEWVALRYGGDEFMAAGPCADSSQPAQLAARIEAQLQARAEELRLPYALRAGVGFVLIGPDDKLQLAECLKKADEEMYRRKSIQHREAF